MSDAGEFCFLSGRLCLDFVNTEMMVAGRRTDGLPDAVAVRDWLAQAGIPAEDQAEPLTEWMERVREFRAALRGMAAHLVRGERVPAGALAAINAVLAARTGHPEVAAVGDGFVERFRWRSEDPISLFAPVAEDAARLLCEGDLSLVKACENPACILFFYDTTKNHTRRWCSMGLCGNRVKAAAYYRRKTGKGQSG